MMSKKIKSKSIAFKLAVAFICLAVFQSILISSLLIAGGVLKQARKNQYKIFSEKAAGRQSNLENEMDNIWTNFNQDTEEICRYFDRLQEEGTEKTADQILEDLSPQVQNALYRTKTTGAFLVLPGQPDLSDGSLPALYFRNNSPERSAAGDSNLYMLIGPWNVAEKREIATTANWSLRLNLNQENQDFVVKPYEAALENGPSEWLGYWSPSFTVNPQDESVITYSVPLFRSDGSVAAIFGVEISVSYLYHYLPPFDLQASDSYGYVIAIRSGDDAIRVAVTNGALQKRVLSEGSILEMETVDEENSIYRLTGNSSTNQLYACAERMGMYYHNTPFEQEEWFLIALMDESSLLQFPHKIERIITYSFLLSMIIGFIFAIVISQWFTRHAKLIELSELPVGAFEFRNHSSKVLMTSQVPHLLGLTREQERNICRDKRQLISFLKTLSASEREGENVFKILTQAGTRWISISRKDSSGSVRCVVEDVTDEVLQKRALQVERDRDGLTGVGNRLAYEAMIQQANSRLSETDKIVLIMCDLNDLKGVNDVFGHDKGDQYIRTAADIICKVFPDGNVFRIGGDEFVVFLQDMEPETVQKRISALAAEMADYDASNEFPAALASGYAFYDPGQDVRLESTLSRADADMYRNKKRMKK